MATITKRNGRWQAKIRKKGQHVLTKSFLSYESAEKWARKTESELERGLYLEDIEEARTTTLKEAATRFTAEHLDRLRHGGREKNRLEAILDRSNWGALALTSLKGKDVAAYVRKREGEGCKPDTIRLDLTLISRLYKHARQEWGLESLRNPVESVRRPSLRGTARTRRLESGEEERLLEAAHDDLLPVIRWALETAMRREEISSLTWNNIDLVRRTAHLPRTKNGEARTVPLSSRALEILDNVLFRIGGQVFEESDNQIKTQWTQEAAMAPDETTTLTWAEIDLVPRTARGLQLSESAMEILHGLLRRIPAPVFGLTKDQITDRMRVTTKRAQLSNLRFHDIRHEATSRLFERGTLDMMEVAQITGHKTLSMLRRYTHLRAEDLAEKLK